MQTVQTGRKEPFFPSFHSFFSDPSRFALLAMVARSISLALFSFFLSSYASSLLRRQSGLLLSLKKSSSIFPQYL